MKWWFYLVPGLLAHLKRCAANEKATVDNLTGQIMQLRYEHQNLTTELKRERACTDYYAYLDNWRYCDAVSTYRASYINHNDYEWHEQYQRYVGGLMARETVKARK